MRVMFHNLSRRYCILIVAGFTFAGTCLPAAAGLLSKMNYMLHSWPPDHRVKKLIVTGNYVKPRILAELVQHQTKNPILLVSPGESGNNLYFLPYGPEAMPLDEEECVEFIELVNPKQVLLLGDSRYVPDSISEKIQRQVSSVRVNSSNWAKNAKTLSDMFMYQNLRARFADMYDKVKDASDSAEASRTRQDAVLAPLGE